MTIRECIDNIDANKPNQYTDADKITWLSQLDYSILNDIILTHKFNFFDKVIAPFRPYRADDMDKELIAPFPYDVLYPAYLSMKIDELNQETARYNNSATMFNAYYEDYAKHINKTHEPLGMRPFQIY